MQAADRGLTTCSHARSPTRERWRRIAPRPRPAGAGDPAGARAGTLRRDLVPEDIVLLLMANAGVVEAAGAAAPDAWRRFGADPRRVPRRRIDGPAGTAVAAATAAAMRRSTRAVGRSTGRRLWIGPRASFSKQGCVTCPRSAQISALCPSGPRFPNLPDRLLAGWLAANPDATPDPAEFQLFVRRSIRRRRSAGRSSPRWVRPNSSGTSSDVTVGPAPAPMPIPRTRRAVSLSTARRASPRWWASRCPSSLAGTEVDHLIRPYRTPGRQVLYSRNDLEAVLLAKRAFVAGHTTDQVREALRHPRVHRTFGSVLIEPQARKIMVLLAERDRYAAEFSEYFLRTEGYEVEVALSADEAEATATALQPELAVVELLISRRRRRGAVRPTQGHHEGRRARHLSLDAGDRPCGQAPMHFLPSRMTHSRSCRS